MVYSQRGLEYRSNAAIFCVLYLLFFISTALWGLELAQLMGLNQVILLDHPDNLTTDDLFNRFYDLVARETKITGVLFESQVCTQCSSHESIELTLFLLLIDDRRGHPRYLARVRNLA